MHLADKEIIKQEAEIPEDFGFNYPYAINEIIQTASVLKQFKAWPEAGGYFDQDAKWVDDMITWQQLLNWKRGEQEKSQAE